MVQGAVEVLFLVLEETVAQDGQDHYDADGQQYSNSYLHRACTGNGAFPPKTEHILLGDATTGLKTLLFLLKVVLVPVATTIGEAGTAFTEWVVIPAWDVLLAMPRPMGSQITTSAETQMETTSRGVSLR